MSSFLSDLRYAYRMLAKPPGFTTVAILTLALGIGANVATYSVVPAVLLNPLPFPQPQQLVRVFDDLRGSNVPDVGISVPELGDYQDRSGVFSDISVVWPISANITGGEHPERVETLATSPNYFTILGANPALGRIYTKQDALPGFTEVIVISDGLWRRMFGADPHILGRKLRLDNDLYAVIGVLPPNFRHPGRTLETDVEAFIAAGYAANPFPPQPIRAARFLPGAIARLKPGLTIPQAQAPLEAFDASLALGRSSARDCDSTGTRCGALATYASAADGEPTAIYSLRSGSPDHGPIAQTIFVGTCSRRFAARRRSQLRWGRIGFCIPNFNSNRRAFRSRSGFTGREPRSSRQLARGQPGIWFEPSPGQDLASPGRVGSGPFSRSAGRRRTAPAQLLGAASDETRLQSAQCSDDSCLDSRPQRSNHRSVPPA